MTEKAEKTVAFVVARLNSSRLPGKQLRKIGDRSILQWIVRSLAGCHSLDQVVLATVAELDNQPLRDFAAEHDLPCFWFEGEVDDVVGRLTTAARQFEADICVLVSADCPLVHGPSVDRMVSALRLQPAADYVRILPATDGTHSLHEGVQVARRRAWEIAETMSDRPELREHQFPAIYQNKDRFQSVAVTLEPSVYGPMHRMSVDTWADLEFMESLSANLQAEGRSFDLPSAVALLKRRPSLLDINAHVYQRRLVEDVKRVLFVVDVGGPYGYGHFMRCRELAGQVVERLSWPVTFLVDDERAARMAEACGFRVLWGALGRPAQAADFDRDRVHPQEAAVLHGLVVIDVSVQRKLPRGWRKYLTSDHPVVVVDREDAMAAEVDLILYPGVTGRAGSDRAGLPPVIEGLEHVILRREVQRYQGLDVHKDIDLLVYLYDDAKKEQVQSLAGEHGWRIAMPV
ncbi:MAG: NTP transferase domain-containing protein, partial [Sedimenticolaceae bacterium]